MIAPIVSQAEWQRLRATAVTVDVRFYLDGRSSAEAFAAGHLPGATFVDLDAWLTGPASHEEGRHPLPDPARFAAAMGALGIGDDDVVLAYDDAGGVIAARLVWMLRATGHPAALIDGGLSAYDGALESATTAREPRTFSARPWPVERLADLGDALAPDAILLDARAPERYLGTVEPLDPRAGHIPGARNLPAGGNVGADGAFLDDAALRARLTAVGVDTAATAAAVVSSCGSGITACHTLLVLEHLGLGTGRLYVGSYSQYSQTALPVQTGASED